MEETNITVKEIIDCLSTFNPDANFHILIKGIEFEITRSSFCWTTGTNPEDGSDRDIDKEKSEATDVAIMVKSNKL